MKKILAQLALNQFFGLLSVPDPSLLFKVVMNARAHPYPEPSWPRTVTLASTQMVVAPTMEAVPTIALIGIRI